jgi:hypothetical protein
MLNNHPRYEIKQFISMLIGLDPSKCVKLQGLISLINSTPCFIANRVKLSDSGINHESSSA